MTTPREQYRQALATLAEKARTALPDLNGRVDAAVKLVLAGDVTLLADGSGEVFSSSDPTVKYHVNGSGVCRDFPQAPSNFCKHRVAVVFARRLQATLPSAEASDADTPPYILRGPRRNSAHPGGFYGDITASSRRDAPRSTSERQLLRHAGRPPGATNLT